MSFHTQFQENLTQVVSVLLNICVKFEILTVENLNTQTLVSRRATEDS
jgi:hypothetical protein